MSLHYGVSKHTYETNKAKALSYVMFFVATSKSRDSYPTSVNVSGFPSGVVYCRGLHQDAGFKVLTHTFDKDNVITAPYSVKFRIRLSLDDGTTQIINLDTVDYYDTDVVRCGRTYILEKEFKFKNILEKKTGSANMVAFDLLFRQKTGGSYGNESSMNIVVDY